MHKILVGHLLTHKSQVRGFSFAAQKRGSVLRSDRVFLRMVGQVKRVLEALAQQSNLR